MLVGILNGSTLMEPCEILIVPRWRHDCFRAGSSNYIVPMAQIIWATSDRQGTDLNDSECMTL